MVTRSRDDITAGGDLGGNPANHAKIAILFPTWICSRNPMATNVFPTTELEELPVGVAEAASKSANCVRNLTYERTILPGIQICKDEATVVAVTADLRLFEPRHLKVE